MSNGDKNQTKFKKKIFNRYDASEVDNYVSKLRDKLRSLREENDELVEKIKDLTKKLDNFREKEETIRNALFMAEKMSSSCIKEARENAEKIILEAKSRAKEVVANTNYEAIEKKDTLMKLRSYVKDYQNRMLLLFKDQLESLKRFMVKDASYDEICESISVELSKITDSRDIESSTVEEVQSFSEEGNDTDAIADEQNSDISVESVKSNEKFKNLQFGNNYSPDVRTKKPFFGMFRKVR